MTLFSGPGVSSIKKKDANSTHLRGLLLRLDEETHTKHLEKSLPYNKCCIRLLKKKKSLNVSVLTLGIS